jgi:hypothetical protein
LFTDLVKGQPAPLVQDNDLALFRGELLDGLGEVGMALIGRWLKPPDLLGVGGNNLLAAKTAVRLTPKV